MIQPALKVGCDQQRLSRLKSQKIGSFVLAFALHSDSVGKGMYADQFTVYANDGVSTTWENQALFADEKVALIH